MTSSENTFFELRETESFLTWGDYGSVLCNGLSMDGGIGEQTCLGRTGPFVPPITFPLASSTVVLTDEAKQLIESTNLTGIGNFHPVRLEKIVAIEWHEWNSSEKLSAEKLPFNGEPEEYVLHNPHDIEIASRIEQLWSWHPLEIGKVLRREGALQLEEVLDIYDVFRLRDKWLSRIIVNNRGKQTVSQIFENWITFRRVRAEVVS